MTNHTLENIDPTPPITSALRDHATELFSVYEGYAETVKDAAKNSLSPRLYALVRLAVALAIPNRELAQNALRLAESYASQTDIAGTVNAACHLRSGAAIAYGRLVFKLLEGTDASNSESGGRSQIALDREFMTKLRKASPKPFDAMARLSTVRQKSSVMSDIDYEIIAIAIATITQCVYCLEAHGNKAKKFGATDEQIADAVHVAISARYEATLFDWSAVSANDG